MQGLSPTATLIWISVRFLCGTAPLVPIIELYSLYMFIFHQRQNSHKIFKGPINGIEPISVDPQSTVLPLNYTGHKVQHEGFKPSTTALEERCSIQLS